MASSNHDRCGVLAGNVINFNSGASKITGGVGSFNTPIGSGTFTASGQTNIGASVATALSRANSMYTNFTAYVPTTSSSEANIGGTTFNPGVIELNNVGGVTIGGETPQITLDGRGTFMFQVINGGLTTDPTLGPVSFNFLNGAIASDVYWLVNGDVNLQTISENITTFAGIVISQGNITMGIGSSAADGLIAPASTPNGIVTLNQNSIVCVESQALLDKVAHNYINIETTLADSKSIRISASNANGGISMSAGAGGISIGKDANSGEIQIGNGSVGKTVTVGNNATGSRMVSRWQSGGWVKSQAVPMALTDNNISVATANLLSGVLVGPVGPAGNLTSSRSLQLDTATNIVAALGAPQTTDAIDFSVINTSGATDFTYALLVGTGGTMVGNSVIYPVTNTGYNAAGSAAFRLVIDSSTTYSVYRLS